MRRFSWLPFWSDTALLLDLSYHGLKAEFTGERKATVGATYTVVLPLGLSTGLVLRVVCRWFDPQTYRFGCEFHGLSSEAKAILRQALESASHMLKVHHPPLGLVWTESLYE
jgi:hypothetical protein